MGTGPILINRKENLLEPEKVRCGTITKKDLHSEKKGDVNGNIGQHTSSFIEKTKVLTKKNKSQTAVQMSSEINKRF